MWLISSGPEEDEERIVLEIWNPTKGLFDFFIYSTFRRDLQVFSHAWLVYAYR